MLTAHVVTIYNNVDDCVANPETTYRIITGTSDSECHTFDEAMPNTDCEQYIRGGWDNMGCDSSSLLPRSVFVRNDKKVCYLFNESHCQGRRRAAVEDGCKAAKVNDGESENFKSFRCSVSSPTLITICLC
jgi:hypothetical protein